MSFGTVGIVGLGMAINAADQVKHDESPFGTLVAGGIFMLGATIVAAVNADLGKMLAVVFLIGSALMHGVGLLDIAGDVAEGKPPKSEHF